MTASYYRSQISLNGSHAGRHITYIAFNKRCRLTSEGLVNLTPRCYPLLYDPPY